MCFFVFFVKIPQFWGTSRLLKKVNIWKSNGVKCHFLQYLVCLLTYVTWNNTPAVYSTSKIRLWLEIIKITRLQSFLPIFDPDHPTLTVCKKSTTWSWEVVEPILESVYVVLLSVRNWKKIWDFDLDPPLIPSEIDVKRSLLRFYEYFVK